MHKQYVPTFSVFFFYWSCQVIHIYFLTTMIIYGKIVPDEYGKNAVPRTPFHEMIKVDIMIIALDWPNSISPIQLPVFD